MLRVHVGVTVRGQHIGQSNNEAARTIGSNTRELNAMLAERSAEITKILDETARPLVERFSETGGDERGDVSDRADEREFFGQRLLVVGIG